MSGFQVHDLAKKIADFELQAAFGVGEGECLGLVGRSGCGKTSLLRLIAGLEAPDRGRLVLRDEDITRQVPQKRWIGYVTQDATLFPALSVLENAVFGLKVRGVSRAEREVQGLEWLKRVDLISLAHSRVTNLSGGEKQRLALVRAMIWKPRLVLLDEPFTALDLTTRKALRSLVMELRTLCPVPMILITHDESDLETLSTRRIVCQESPGVRRFIDPQN